ncbi:MAG: diguanylate cyclase domain-containing protein, partial [Sutterella sp.]
MTDAALAYQHLCDYIDDLLVHPRTASLDVGQLPASFQQTGAKLRTIGEHIQEAMRFSDLMAQGRVCADARLSSDNVIGEPARNIQGALSRLISSSGRLAEGHLDERISDLNELGAAFNAMAQRLQVQQEAYQKALLTDSLTGLGNRLAFSRDAKAIEANGRRASLAVIDLDNLKHLNDLFGHAEGDRYIITAAKNLMAAFPKLASIYRIGGDEMAVISETLSADELDVRLSRVRLDFENEFPQAEDCRYSFSYGVAAYTPKLGKRISVMIDKADQLMYADKLRKHAVRLPREATVVCISAEDQDEFLHDPLFDVFGNLEDSHYFYMCNLKTNISRWSKKAVADFDMPSEYMFDAGSIWLYRIHPDDREMYSKDIAEVFGGLKGYHKLTYRARRRDGVYVWCSCHG